MTDKKVATVIGVGSAAESAHFTMAYTKVGLSQALTVRPAISFRGESESDALWS